MVDANRAEKTGWKIVESIGLELDAAIAITGGTFLVGGITSEIMALQQTISADWQEEYSNLYGSMKWFCSVLETASILTGVLDEADYSRATLIIRQTTPRQALENMKVLAASADLYSNSEESLEDAIIQLVVRYRKLAYSSIGLSHPNDEQYEDRLVREIRFCLDILRGGKLHDRFWHWLDRFYYEVYRPWREERRQFLDSLKQKVATVLGSSQSNTQVANLEWLSDVNPALRYPEINRAIRSGEIFVNFWLEPFGFADTFVLLPDKCYLSFADPGKMYENFLEYSRELSSQVQALADPTRLIILRMIRALSMTNTNMAAYLRLSRPTVSIHAKILREAGFIRSWEEGRITRHEINPEAVKKLFVDLAEFLDLPPETFEK